MGFAICLALFCLAEQLGALTLVRAVLGQGFAAASVPFPMVRTEKWVELHLALLTGAD